MDNSSTPEAALETPLTISVLLDRTEFCDYAHGLEVEADSDSLPSVTLDTLSTKKEDPRKNPVSNQLFAMRNEMRPLGNSKSFSEAQ